MGERDVSGYPAVSRIPTPPIAWLPLALVLGVLWLGGLVANPAKGRHGFGEQATHAMQAFSLAHDLDLSYSNEDLERFRRLWGSEPEGLVLRDATDDGARTFGRSALYGLTVAPFARLAPVRGALWMNVLVLSVAALVATHTLARRHGHLAPAWVAVLLCGAVAFRYAFLVQPEALYLACVVTAFALVYRTESSALGGPDTVYGGEDGGVLRESIPGALRWLGVGGLLAVPATGHPLYALLLVPVWLAVPESRRAQARGALVAGFLALVLAAATLEGGLTNQTLFLGERAVFTSSSGFPGDGLAMDAEAPPEGRRSLGVPWNEGTVPQRMHLMLWGWNLLFLAVGRNVGLLPYFLPLVLVLWGWRTERSRSAILLVSGIGLLGFAYMAPFDFFGGQEGALANRLFLPFYGALWFVPTRSMRPLGLWLILVLAAPFLYPSWLMPWAGPVEESGEWRHVSAVAQRYLPHETTQQYVVLGTPIRQGEVVTQFVAPPAVEEGKAGHLNLDSSGRVELVVVHPRQIEKIYLEAGRNATPEIELNGATLTHAIYRPSGRIDFEVELGRPTARHPMWWTWEAQLVHRLRIRMPTPPTSPLRLRVRDAGGGWMEESVRP